MYDEKCEWEISKLCRSSSDRVEEGTVTAAW